MEQKILIADEGMFYTDGVSYGRKIILPPNADETLWRQVTKDELPTDEEASEADYLAALARLGVK